MLDEERGICLSVEVPYKRYDEMAGQAEAFYDAMEQDQERLETGVKIAGTLEVLEEEGLDNSQVIWVHTASQQSRYGLSYYVLWEMLDGSTRKVVLPSEKKCKALVNGYSGFFHIVTGNKPEYSYLFRFDREAFLDLKYRTL